MKKTLFFTALLSILLFANCSRGIRQAPPMDEVEVMPMRPSPSHIWINGHYGYQQNRYIWNHGFYSVPPRGKTVWQRGEYYQNSNGYHTYKQGYWR